MSSLPHSRKSLAELALPIHAVLMLIAIVTQELVAALASALLFGMILAEFAVAVATFIQIFVFGAF